jgi:hypothetical protein
VPAIATLAGERAGGRSTACRSRNIPEQGSGSGRLGGVRIFLSRKSRRDRAEVRGLNGAPAPFKAPLLPVAEAPR